MANNAIRVVRIPRNGGSSDLNSISIQVLTTADNWETGNVYVPYVSRGTSNRIPASGTQAAIDSLYKTIPLIVYIPEGDPVNPCTFALHNNFTADGVTFTYQILKEAYSESKSIPELLESLGIMVIELPTDITLTA